MSNILKDNGQSEWCHQGWWNDMLTLTLQTFNKTCVVVKNNIFCDCFVAVIFYKVPEGERLIVIFIGYKGKNNTNDNLKKNNNNKNRKFFLL